MKLYLDSAHFKKPALDLFRVMCKMEKCPGIVYVDGVETYHVTANGEFYGT